MGEHNFESKPVILQGVIFFLSGVTYLFLVRKIIEIHGKDSILAKAAEKNYKGTVSWVGYLVAIGLGFFFPKVSAIIYFLIALLWLIPDREIEKLIED